MLDEVKTGLLSLFVALLLGGAFATSGSFATVGQSIAAFLFTSGFLFGILLMTEFSVRFAKDTQKQHPIVANLYVLFSSLITVFFFFGLIALQ